MDELTSLFGSTSIYSPQEEFIILERALRLTYLQWKKQSDFQQIEIINTRYRYLRYIRNLDFSERSELERNIEMFIYKTRNISSSEACEAREAPESEAREACELQELFILSQKIDFEIYTIVCK